MSAFDELVMSHERRLLRLCWLLTLDEGDAADIAQETLARAWREHDHVTTHPDPGAWLRRVAINLCWDRSRRRATVRRKRHLTVVADRVEPATADHDLERAVRSLSDRQRQVVVLRYWADLDLQGCADAMGVSLGSAKKHLARAHAALAAAPELARETS